MNKKDEIKLEVLSNIDDDIIEKQSGKRYRLSLKNRYSRKKLIGWLSAAACFVLIFSFFVPILLGFQKQVPVYEGMTVSNVMPTVQLKRESGATPLVRRSMKRENTILITNLLAREEILGDKKQHTRLPDVPVAIEDDRTLYYAKKNEDIYITIHIINPEQFEILSFTLNGTKYQSYMFEDGSDSENLILKVNVGDVQGIVEYTIDAIKYIDGTTTKDVRMEGDRTVKVGVDPEEKPTVKLDAIHIGAEEIRFDASLSDSLSLIKESAGTLMAELYDGDRCVSTEELSLDEVSSVTFSSLIAGKNYTLRIVANYDALDGDGFGAYQLYEYEFFTDTFVEITNARLENETDLCFDLNVAEGKNISVQKIELMNVDVVERTGDERTRSFTGLSFGTYRVVVTYAYGDDGSKMGYAHSNESLSITKLGNINDIVREATVTEKCMLNLQIYYPTIGNYAVHHAIDLVAGGADQGVYSTMSAKVTEVLNDMVVLSSFDEQIKLVYRSLDDILVAEGDTVFIGQKIGSVGQTYDMEASEQAHVHLELYYLDEEQDPLKYEVQDPLKYFKS